MKKFFLFLTLCSMLTLQANEGAYLGIQLGGSLAISDQNGASRGNYNPSYIDSNSNNYWNTDIIEENFVGSIYAGYGKRWGKFILGLEGFLQYVPIKLTNQEEDSVGFASAATFNLNSDVIDTTFASAQYGLDFRCGMVLPYCTFLYGRLGVGVAHVKRQVLDTFSGNALFDDTWELIILKSKKSTQPAFRVGGGLEKKITPHISLRADYVFSDYGSFSIEELNASSSVNGDPIESSISMKEHISNHQFTFGISYYFCAQKNQACNLSASQPITIGSSNDFCFQKNLECNLTAPQSSFCGFYIGAAAGGSSYLDSQKGIIDGLQADNPIMTIANSSPHLRDNSFQGQLFLGYGRRLCFFYIGAEAFTQYANVNTQESFDEVIYTDEPNGNVFTASQRNQMRFSPWQFGADIRLGVFLYPTTLLYSHGGVALAWITNKSDGIMRGEIPLLPESWELPISISAKRKKVGSRVGLGLEQEICKKTHLRIDYTYSNFGNIKFNESVTGTSTTGSDLTLLNRLSSKFSSHTILLGLSWQI